MIFGHQQLTYGHFKFSGDFQPLWDQKWKMAIKWAKINLEWWKFIYKIFGHVEIQKYAYFQNMHQKFVWLFLRVWKSHMSKITGDRSDFWKFLFLWLKVHQKRIFLSPSPKRVFLILPRKFWLEISNFRILIFFNFFNFFNFFW